MNSKEIDALGVIVCKEHEKMRLLLEEIIESDLLPFDKTNPNSLHERIVAMLKEVSK